MKTLFIFLTCLITFIAVSDRTVASTKIIDTQNQPPSITEIKPKTVEKSTLGIASALIGIAAVMVSIVSLYIGIGPLSLVGFLLGIGATITGFVSKKKINAGNGEGKGASVVGIVTGLTTVISWIGLTLLAIAALSAWGR